MFNELEHPDDWIGGKHSYSVRTGATSSEIIRHIRRYFTEPVSHLVYPAKSYAVALVYSALLEEYFGVDRLEALKDPDLLYGNDRFFRPYTDTTKHIYDAVLDEFPPFNAELPQVRTTIDSFKREFYLTPNPYFDNTDLS